MFNENATVKALEVENHGMKYHDGSEKMNRSIIGEYVDTIYHADGRVEVREAQNCIINDIGKLIACLFKGQTGYSRLGYWAVGSGSDSWDNVNPTPAQPTDTGCINELGRIAIPSENIVFLDSSNKQTTSVTNRLQITLTFTESDCNGVWREFAIYGGNATATRGSGIAINHKNHGILVKTSSMVVERQIRFTFN